MRLQKGRVYVGLRADEYGNVQPIIRVPPEPPLYLSVFAVPNDAQRYVLSVWPMAIRTAVADVLYGEVDNRPPAQSLRGKI